MDQKVKHWIIILERIKTEIMWTPADQFPSTQRIDGLIKEMEQAQEEVKKDL